MYIYFVYLAISKSHNQLLYCLKRTETSVFLIVIDGVLCDVHSYTVAVSHRRST